MTSKGFSLCTNVFIFFEKVLFQFHIDFDDKFLDIQKKSSKNYNKLTAIAAMHGLFNMHCLRNLLVDIV